MKARPILFSAPMVRALLNGTKTQTRRVVKPQPWASCVIEEGLEGESPFVFSALGGYGPGFSIEERRTPCRCPYGQPGDRLWVREAFKRDIDHADSRKLIVYRADDAVHDAGLEGAFDFPDVGWKPSIHMPRWASRITLEVTGVRVERLQTISEADVLAEGIDKFDSTLVSATLATETRTRVPAYRALWESINGPGSWDANPWVWVVAFKRLEAA